MAAPRPRRGFGASMASQSPRASVNPKRKAGKEAAPKAKELLLARVTSLMSVMTAICAVFISGLTIRLAKEGQITGRYASAVEQLGEGNAATRVGAMYALSRLAFDSKDDRTTIIELLTDYVKAKIPARPDNTCRYVAGPPMDVVAALRVLFFKITGELRTITVDLTGICLKEVSFPGADLTCMLLDNATIENSDFDRARLVDASLQNAYLRSSAFHHADFTRAVAIRAKFGDNTTTPSAEMDGAVLRDALLSEAEFVDVTLAGADFTGATLTGAYPKGVDPKGPYLEGTKGLPAKIDRSSPPPEQHSRARRCPE